MASHIAACRTLTRLRQRSKCLSVSSLSDSGTLYSRVSFLYDFDQLLLKSTEYTHDHAMKARTLLTTLGLAYGISLVCGSFDLVDTVEVGGPLGLQRVQANWIISDLVS